MTERESAQIIGIMQTVYPDSFKNLSADALRSTVKIWAKVFEDDPASAVQAAVMAHISASQIDSCRRRGLSSSALSV